MWTNIITPRHAESTLLLHPTLDLIPDPTLDLTLDLIPDLIPDLNPDLISNRVSETRQGSMSHSEH